MIQERYHNLAKKGNELREKLLGNSKDDSTLISISYKLLNSVKNEEVNRFIDIVYRLYNSVNEKKTPEELLEILSNAEDFRNMGQAFLLGFRGSCCEKEREENI